MSAAERAAVFTATVGLGNFILEIAVRDKLQECVEAAHELFAINDHAIQVIVVPAVPEMSWGF
jgi:hypothetical protein